jgi:hypothetical protein
MKRYLRVQALGNIDLIIGIGLSAIIAVLGIIGIASPALLSAAVLAVLALQLGVVTHLRGQLNTYAKLSREQQPVLRQLNQWLAGQGSVSSVYRYDYPDISPEIAQAAAIDILAGLTLKTSIGVFATAIEAALHGGAKIRVICPNPENLHLMEAAAIASAHRNSGSAAADDVRLNLLLAKTLKDANAQALGSLELRVIDTLPGVGLIRIQGPADSHLYWKVMLIGAAWGGYPVFCLSEVVDERLCDDLKRSFETAWSRSTSYT